jgi:hypothetical protein
MTRPTHTTAVTWSSPTARATLRLVVLLDVGLRGLHSLQDRLRCVEGDERKLLTKGEVARLCRVSLSNPPQQL